MRTYACGQAGLFAWSPPPGLAGFESASLGVAWPAGAETYTLTARGADTVTAISADRRQVTVTWGATGEPIGLLGGTPLPAILTDGAQGQTPVRVAQILSSDEDGGVLVLAEALPRTVAASGYIEWLGLFGTLSIGDMPATPVKAVAWTLTYEPLQDGIPVGASHVDRGVLAVARAPFETGLTHAGLVAYSPWLMQVVLPGQSSFAPQIAIALTTLKTRILVRLTEAQRAVGIDCVAGGQFVSAHAMEARLLVLRAMQEAGQNKREQIAAVSEELDAELGRIFKGGLEWFDANDDGVVDEGESSTSAAHISVSCHTDDAEWDRTDTDARTAEPWSRVRLTDAR